MREMERVIMLNVIDNQWKDHLLSMDHLKEGIGMRAYGQKDPLIEYKKESFILFQDMMDRIEDETIRYLFFLQITQGPTSAAPVLPFPTDEDEDEEEEQPEPDLSQQQKAAAQASIQDFTRNIQRKKEKELAELQFVGGDGSAAANKQVIKGDKVGRNDPCPCGSGKKYKKCHGA
jgi:preprotein translocase subunit SecA